MKKNRKIIAVMLALTVGIMFSVSLPAYGATSTSPVKWLQQSKKYTQYDFNGDGKRDTFLVKSKRDPLNNYVYKYIYVYINGHKVYTTDTESLTGHESRQIARVMVGGKPMLYIVPYGENSDNYPVMLKYSKSKKKMIVMARPYKMSKIGYHTNVTLKTVKGSTVTFKYGLMTYSLANVMCSLKYTYSHGKLTQSSNSSAITSYQSSLGKTYWTANRTMKVVTAPNSTKKVTMIKVGNKVKIDRFYINNKHTASYFHVKIKGGKSGWVRGLTSYPTVKLFREVAYAG